MTWVKRDPGRPVLLSFDAMADSSRVPAGATAPYELRYFLRSRTFDLTRVVSARFVLRRSAGRGAEESWPAVASQKTPERVLLTHLFATPSEVPAEDLIVFEPRVTLQGGGGEVVGAARTLVVFAHPSRL